EGVGRDALAIALVSGDAEVAQFQLLVLAHEHVEGRQVAVQRLAAMQRIERPQNPRDLAPHDALGLRPFALEPGADVPVLGVLHHDAVAHLVAGALGEPIENAERARFAFQELGEVRLAEPRRETLADLDADLRRETAGRRRGGEINLAEAALPDEAVESIGAAALGALGRDVLFHADYLHCLLAVVKLTAVFMAFASTRVSARFKTVSMRTEFRVAVRFQCPTSRPSSSTACMKVLSPGVNEASRLSL